MTSKNKEHKAAFSRHSQQQLQANRNTNGTDNNDSSTAAVAVAGGGGDFGQMSLTGRLLVFIVVPCLTGLLGLASSYLQSKRALQDDDTSLPHTVDFDRDFVTPFLLGLAFVIVIGFQTGGFKGGDAAGAGGRKFALSWPKAKRVRKVRRERVIVDDDADDLDTKKER